MYHLRYVWQVSEYVVLFLLYITSVCFRCLTGFWIRFCYSFEHKFTFKNKNTSGAQHFTFFILHSLSILAHVLNATQKGSIFLLTIFLNSFSIVEQLDNRNIWRKGQDVLNSFLTTHNLQSNYLKKHGKAWKSSILWKTLHIMEK